MTTKRRGPLAGIRVLEIPNIGPLQHAGMMLADLGAEVLRLERRAHVLAGTGLQGPYNPYSLLDRGRRRSSHGSPSAPTWRSRASGQASRSGSGSDPGHCATETRGWCTAA